MKRKNMKFNAILPLKWQNTADIVAILVGLKQKTVSLMCRKCARRNCGTMIASFRKGRGKKQRFLHYSIRYGTRNAVSASKPKRTVTPYMYKCLPNLCPSGLSAWVYTLQR